MTDQEIIKKLLRQVKILNAFIAFISLLFITMFVLAGIGGFIAYKEIRDARSSLTSLQTKAEDSLDVRSQLCADSGSVSALLKSQSDVCN